MTDQNARIDETEKITLRRDEVTPENVVRKLSMMGWQMQKCHLQAIANYFAGYPLVLCGAAGTGKSVFFKMLSEVKDDCNRPLFPFAVLQMSSLAAFSLADLRNFLFRYNDHELVLDDLGAEPRIVDYGTRCELLDCILGLRESTAARIHVTTNLLPDAFRERYGKRNIDRLGFSSWVKFDGESMRDASHGKIPLSRTSGYVLFDRTVEMEDKINRASYND
jgi:hypothetical protein